MTYQSYKELLKEKRVWYKAVNKCYCPILNEDVFFTSKGFYHLMRDGLNEPRTRKDRMYRLGLLPLVIPVLKCATGIFKYTSPTYSKKLNKNVEYWELKETVGKQNTIITIVLRRIGTGNISFYSVRKKRDKRNNTKKTKKPSK